MKNLSNTEARLKKTVAHKKVYILVNKGINKGINKGTQQLFSLYPELFLRINFE